MRKYCKGYDQGLHQHHHQHQFSNHIDKLLFVKLDSQSYNNHTYKTAVSYEWAECLSCQSQPSLFRAKESPLKNEINEREQKTLYDFDVNSGAFALSVPPE